MDLTELKRRMKGVSVVQITPFNADGSIDLEGLRENTRWLAERAAGKNFIFTPVGSTGEFYAMSPEEIKAVIKVVVEEAKTKAVLLAGAGQAGTIETVRMCQYAQSVGADGVQIIIPYYHIPEEEGMFQHFKQIAESVAINFGIMIYNNPAVSGSWIRPSLMKTLSKIPNIIAVKENTPDIISFCAMRRAVNPEDTVILCGSAELMFAFEAWYDCPGFVSSAANFMPDLSYSIYEAAAARDFDKLRELVSIIEPFFSFTGRVTQNHGPHTGIPGAGDAYTGYMYIGVVKAAMDIMGLSGGKVRLPLVDINEKEKDELRDILKAMGLV